MYYISNLVLFLNKEMHNILTLQNNTDMRNKVKDLAKQAYKADLDMLLLLVWYWNVLG